MQICQVLLQYWPNVQCLASKYWSYHVEPEAIYASFPLNLSAHIHSTMYWVVHSEVNSNALLAKLTHPYTYKVGDKLTAINKVKLYLLVKPILS